MPQLNKVLEELGIHHKEHEVPLEVLATIEEKKRKAATKNVTAAAETKKRKGVGASQVAAKKQKTSVTAEASAASATSSTSRSVKASANAKEDSAKNSGRCSMSTGAKKFVASKDGGCGQGAVGEDHPEPSAANPLPGVLGGDSSSSDEAGDAGHRGAHPSDGAEAGGASRRHPMDVEVLEVSEDEVDSQPPAMFHSISFQPQSHRRAGVTDAEASMYQLHLSKLYFFSLARAFALDFVARSFVAYILPCGFV
jgi:hypothetical protein